MIPTLNRRLTLETLERVADDAGGYTETWQGLGNLWAEVRPGTGRESHLSGLPVSVVPATVAVRAAPPGALSRPEAGQRFRDGGRVYRIVSVAEADPRARFLKCVTREEEIST